MDTLMDTRILIKFAPAIFGLLLAGCGSMQTYLDQQSQALHGALPISAHTVQKWTIGLGDVVLEKTYLTKKYRITSKFLKNPATLYLDTIEKKERFNLSEQTVLVLHGRYGAEGLPACEVISFGKRYMQTLLPAQNEHGKHLTFRPSANGQNLIGAFEPATSNDSFFVSTLYSHHWPLKFASLNREDRNLYLPKPSPGPVIDEPKNSMPVKRVAAQPASTPGKTKKKPTPAVSTATSNIKILAPAPKLNLPTSAKVVSQKTGPENKPVLRLD